MIDSKTWLNLKDRISRKVEATFRDEWFGRSTERQWIRAKFISRVGSRLSFTEQRWAHFRDDWPFLGPGPRFFVSDLLSSANFPPPNRRGP